MSAVTPAPITPTESQVWQALELVYDPELEIDLVNLGLVYEITIRARQVELLMTLTTMGCPAQDEIQQDVIDAVAGLPGVDEVKITWTFSPPWTPGRVSEEGRDMLMALGYL